MTVYAINQVPPGAQVILKKGSNLRELHMESAYEAINADPTNEVVDYRGGLDSAASPLKSRPAYIDYLVFRGSESNPEIYLKTDAAGIASARSRKLYQVT